MFDSSQVQIHANFNKIILPTVLFYILINESIIKKILVSIFQYLDVSLKENQQTDLWFVDLFGSETLGMEKM